MWHSNREQTLGEIVVSGFSPRRCRAPGDARATIRLTVEGADLPARPEVWLYWNAQPCLRGTDVEVQDLGAGNGRVTATFELSGWVAQPEGLDFAVVVADGDGLTHGHLSAGVAPEPFVLTA